MFARARLPRPATLAGKHVAVTGNDGSAGTSAAPWRTIQHAADSAVPGDTVYIHAGTYREQVDPPTGGTSFLSPITLRAAPGESVTWSGSERITSWSSLGGGVWEAVIANAFFGSFNPYALTISGSFIGYGNGTYHRGQVYLDGIAYREVTSSGAVSSVGLWWCSVGGSDTTIRAHFGAGNPNTQVAEINVRRAWIYPTAVDGSGFSGVDFINLHGFIFEHAACNWANPQGEEAPQEGGIMPHGGLGWTIERNWITHARNCGVSIGLWDGEQSDSLTGHHVIRFNTIEHCGQAGIVGSHGCLQSTIEHNLIQDIHLVDDWGGTEVAAIKLHNCVDGLIKGNVVRRVTNGYGIYLDWQNQGCRIDGNVVSDIDADALFLEANRGPNLVVNNVFDGSCEALSARTAWVHNLLLGSPILGGDGRPNEFWTPHSDTHTGSAATITQNGDCFFNNLVIGSSGFVGLGNATGYASNRNVFWGSGGPTSWGDAQSIHSSGHSAGFGLTDLSNGVTVSFAANSDCATVACPVVDSTLMGTHSPAPQGIENRDGSPVTIDLDALGNARGASPKAGPFQDVASGANSFTIHAGADAP